MSGIINNTKGIELATRLEVADTGWRRMRGLLGRSRQNFGRGQGLWLRGCDGIHTIGMTFPIDALYLDKDNRVVHQYRDLRPWRICRVRFDTKSVLELPAGTLAASQTETGDRLLFLSL